MSMKIVVIGGTGLIGSKVVEKLKSQGHEALAAAPNTGVNTISGEGLAQALAGAEVVIDVANSPSFEDQAAMDFFQTGGRNVAAAEAAAGVAYHLALSVVGTDRLLDSGYFRAKLAQESLIKASLIPYTIVHATQFFEFIRSIPSFSMVGGAVHLPPVQFQPMAAQDVASALVTQRWPSLRTVRSRFADRRRSRSIKRFARSSNTIRTHTKWSPIPRPLISESR
jgi:uncharacterized protein YbjT (DUF2867 family)